MDQQRKETVNVVASAFENRCLLDAQHKTTTGPNNIILPLPRDRQKLAFTLEHVLTADECNRLVEVAEDVGFGVAGLGTTGAQHVNTDIRDSARLIVDDIELAWPLYTRLRPYLPTVWEGRRILGLNEHLKFLRYHPGQKFVAHFDGAFCRAGTQNMTRLTVQFYLTQLKLQGGCTNFIGHDGEEVVKCSPNVGRALIFQHNILHEGEVVQEGVKYTIRTDVEYGGISFGGRLQELVGFGCSPIEQRKRALRLLLPICVGFLAWTWSPFRLQA